MQPKTSIVFDRVTFDRVKKNVNGVMAASRGRRQSAEYAAPVPLDVGMELTTRCNLHCKHCFLWNEAGYYENDGEFRHKDLAYPLVEKVLRETASQKSNLYFWGTEPLLYRHWDELSHAIERDPRWTVVCTNGTLIESNLESLLRISANLAVVVSVDGFPSSHDEMRGKGAFAKTLQNIQLLLAQRRQGSFRGMVTLHTVLSEKLVPELYDYCVFVESLGVDSLYVGFPWYINTATARDMDRYVGEHLGFLSNGAPADRTRSWHTYRYRLDSSIIPALKHQMDTICKRSWKLRFRFQPALEPDDLEDFLAGGAKPVQGRTECYAVSNRMDVRADGTVTACQCYPELVVGDLANEGVLEIWHGPKMKEMRRTIARGLTPACAKCILLYLNGK